jgi:glutamine amidotransferase
MADKIVIIDYQMGNLRSVQKALEHVGFAANISSCPRELKTADKLILPGVGAFGDAIDELSSRELIEPIIEAINAGKPFLGICLGLQLLFEWSDEGGRHNGLGVLQGSVKKFEGGLSSTEGQLKVPHMGWNQVKEELFECPLMKGIAENQHFYFVHSYYVQPDDPATTWLTSQYGSSFCAAVWRENLFATQFHPEKSQGAGLMLLKNFCQIG